jgi:hypothetical protein
MTLDIDPAILHGLIDFIDLYGFVDHLNSLNNLRSLNIKNLQWLLNVFSHTSK